MGREFTVKPQQTCLSSHFKAKSELLVPSEMMKKKKKKRKRMHCPKWKLKMGMAGFLQNDRMLETYAPSKVWHHTIVPKMRRVDSRWLADDQSSQQVAFTLCLLKEGRYISLTLSPIRPRICWEPSRRNTAHLVF